VSTKSRCRSLKICHLCHLTRSHSSSSDEYSPATSPVDDDLTQPAPADSQTDESSKAPIVIEAVIEAPRTGGRKGFSIHELISLSEEYDELRDFEEDEGTLALPSRLHRANFTAYDCIDPFGSTPVRVTPKIHDILQATLKIYPYAGNNYKLAFLPPHIRSTITQFPIADVVQRSVYKNHHVYALMAAMLARLKHTFKMGVSDDPEVVRAQAATYLKQELVRCARTGDVDKQTILDILFLCVNETQYQMYDEVQKHLKIVGKLLHLLDTNQVLDKWISETAAHIDNQYALSTGRRPVLPHTFDPGPMLPERMAILRREAHNLRYYRYPNPISDAVARNPNAPLGLTDVMSDLAATLDLRMGSQFIQALKVGAFPGAVGNVIADLIDCIEIAKVVWLSPLAVCFDAEWLCRKARACLRALLAIAPENNIGPMDLICKCTEVVRLCLMILLTHACTLIGPQTAKANVTRLRAASGYALKFWAPAIGWTEDCIPVDPNVRLDSFCELQAGFVLWSLCIGCWTADGLPEQEYFIHRAVNVCGYFGYTTYDDLDSHLAQYLYSKSLQVNSLKKVATRLGASHGHHITPDREYEDRLFSRLFR
jgi:hypothetical protein